MNIWIAAVLITVMTGCAATGGKEVTLIKDEPLPSANIKAEIDTIDNTNNMETAKALFEEGTQRMKDNPRVALEIFNEIVRLAPEGWTPHYNSALTHIKLREFRRAEAELNNSLNKKAPPVIIYNTLGTIYIYMDNKQKAIDIFEKSLAVEKTAMALVNLANLYHMTGQTKMTLRYLNELEIMAGANKAIYYNTALLWYKMGRYQNAEEAFEKILNSGKGDTKVLYLKAQALLKQGKYDAGLKVFQEMAAANAIDPVPYREMGIIYELYFGDLDKAMENYRSYIAKGGEKSKEVSEWLDIVRTRLSQEKEKGQGGG